MSDNYDANTRKLEEFLSERHLKIPYYQRGYSWEEIHVSNFVDDLLEYKSDNAIPYFFGYVTITPGDDKFWYLIDGQQRIATTIIFLICIRDLSREEGLEDLASNIEEQFFNTKGGMAKLTLDDTDNKIFKILYKEQNYKEKIENLKENDEVKTHQNIWKAYRTIRNNLKDRLNKLVEDIATGRNMHLLYEQKKKQKTGLENKRIRKKNILNKLQNEGNSGKLKELHDEIMTLNEDLIKTDKELITMRLGIASDDLSKCLKSYRDALLNKSVISVLIVRHPGSEHILFDRMNERGLKLNDADLAKNLILSKIYINNGKVDDEVKEWSNAESKIGRDESKMVEFLRSYLIAFRYKWLSKKDFVSSLPSIYDDLTSILENQNASDLLSDICEKVDDYAILKNEKESDKIPYDLKKNLESLERLGASTVDPILMVAFRKYQLDDFKRITKLVLNWFFRVKTVANTHAGKMRNELARIAYGIENDGWDFTHVQEKMIALEPKLNVNFEDKFKTMPAKGDVARYILEQIEEHESPSGQKDTKISDTITLEHIMPRSMDKWMDYIIKENKFSNKKAAHAFHQEYKDRLGNLTLIDNKNNSAIGDRLFSEKSNGVKEKKLYGFVNSNLYINKMIHKNYKVWNKKNIVDRQNKFTNIAKDIWKLS